MCSHFQIFGILKVWRKCDQNVHAYVCNYVCAFFYMFFTKCEKHDENVTNILKCDESVTKVWRKCARPFVFDFGILKVWRKCAHICARTRGQISLGVVFGCRNRGLVRGPAGSGSCQPWAGAAGAAGLEQLDWAGQPGPGRWVLLPWYLQIPFLGGAWKSWDEYEAEIQ